MIFKENPREEDRVVTRISLIFLLGMIMTTIQSYKFRWNYPNVGKVSIETW